MDIIKKNKKLFLKTILFFTFLIFGFVYAFANIANDNVNRQEHRKVISEEIQKNKHEAWQGTAVPNTGYVEKVYINTNLSAEEVISIIESANLLFVDNGYAVIADNIDAYIFILNNNGIYSIYSITNDDSGNNEIIFDGNTWLNEEKFNYNPLVINNNVVSELGGMSVGNQNEALSSLFSITPFVEEKEATIIEIIGNGIADAAGKFGEVLTFGFEAVKKVMFNEDNTLTYTGSVVVILVSTAMISLAFRMVLKALGFIRVG